LFQWIHVASRFDNARRARGLHMTPVRGWHG
jgi:hypothetical protein